MSRVSDLTVDRAGYGAVGWWAPPLVGAPTLETTANRVCSEVIIQGPGTSLATYQRAAARHSSQSGPDECHLSLPVVGGGGDGGMPCIAHWLPA